MDTICNTVITLDGDTFPGTFFSLTSKKYKPNVQCLLTIKGSTVSQRIIITVEKFDVECGGDKLLVYDGKKDSATLLNTDTSKQCGKKIYYLRVKFILIILKKNCFFLKFLDIKYKYCSD